MSTPNPVPTLPQAQAALILVQMCEAQLATLNQQLTTAQGQVTSLQSTTRRTRPRRLRQVNAHHLH